MAAWSTFWRHSSSQIAFEVRAAWIGHALNGRRAARFRRTGFIHRQFARAFSEPVHDPFLGEMAEPVFEPALFWVVLKFLDRFRHRNDRLLHDLLGLVLAQAGFKGGGENELPVNAEEFAPSLVVIPILQPAQQALACRNKVRLFLHTPAFAGQYIRWTRREKAFNRQPQTLSCRLEIELNRFMTKSIVNPAKSAPAAGPYSHGVRVGELLYCAGQIPLDPDTGQLVPGDIRAQTERVLQNILLILQDQGLAMANIVKTTVFMTNLADFAAMNEIYGQHFHQGTAGPHHRAGRRPAARRAGGDRSDRPLLMSSIPPIVAMGHRVCHWRIVGLADGTPWRTADGRAAGRRLEEELRQQLQQREQELERQPRTIRPHRRRAGRCRGQTQRRQREPNAGRNAEICAPPRSPGKALANSRGLQGAQRRRFAAERRRSFCNWPTRLSPNSRNPPKATWPRASKPSPRLVQPLKEQLESYQRRLQQSESSQAAVLGEVKKQLEGLAQNSQTLSSETFQLRKVLSSNQARGRWGEETLRRVVEAAGMSPHCDFTEQTAVGRQEAGPDRPSAGRPVDYS